MNTIRKQIAETIKDVRRSRNESLDEFTKAFNDQEPKTIKIHRITLSKYEHGHVNIPADKFLKILELSPDSSLKECLSLVKKQFS